VHADRHGRTGAGSDDRTIVPATLPEGLEVARAHGVAGGVEGAVGALLRVLVRTVGVERALGAVVDHAAVLEVEQAGDLEFPDVQRGAKAPRPLRIRVTDDALVRIADREAVGTDVRGALGCTGADRREIDARDER